MKSQINQIEIKDVDSVIIIDLFAEVFVPFFTTKYDFLCSLQNEVLFKKNNLSAHKREYFEQVAFKKSLANPDKNKFDTEFIYKTALNCLGITQNSELITELTNLEINHFAKSLVPHKEIIDQLKKALNLGINIYGVSDLHYPSKDLVRIFKEAGIELTNILTTSETSTPNLLTLTNEICKSDLNNRNSIFLIGNSLHIDRCSKNSNLIKLAYLSSKNIYYSDLINARSCIAPQLFPSLRYEEPYTDAFSVLSHNGKFLDSWHSFGFFAVGSIFYSFAKFIELNTERKHNKKDIAFLMRDGFLPRITSQVINKDFDNSIDLYINRHVAISSSLRNKEDLIDLISSNLYNSDVAILCNLLNLNNSEKNEFISAFISLINNSNNHHLAILEELVTSDKFFNIIVQHAKNKTTRLKKHILKQLNNSSLKSITLIDLGYAGTIQDHLNKISQDLGIHFDGIYLLTDKRSISKANGDKKSLIDYNKTDPRIIELILKNVMLLEIISSKPCPSLYDYDEFGNPLFNEEVKEQINIKDLSNLHEGVLLFSKVANENLKNHFNVDPKAIVIDICRLFYYPTSFEIALLEKVNFQLDLGTNNRIPFFDTNSFTRNFRFLGLNALNTNTSQYASSAFSARSSSLLASNTILSQDRYGIDFSKLAFSYNALSINLQSFDNYNLLIAEKTISIYENQVNFYSLKITPIQNNTRFLISFKNLSGFIRIHELQNSTKNSNDNLSSKYYFHDSQLLPNNFYFLTKKTSIEILIQNSSTSQTPEFTLNFELIAKDLYAPS